MIKMSKQQYVYFVSYYLQNKIGNGFGSCCIERDKPLDYYDDILEVRKKIQQDHIEQWHDISILNFIPLKGVSK